MSKTTEIKKGAPVPSKLASAMRKLDTELRAYFGCDYAYIIVGHGQILAASNFSDGRIAPQG